MVYNAKYQILWELLNIYRIIYIKILNITLVKKHM